MNNTHNRPAPGKGNYGIKPATCVFRDGAPQGMTDEKPSDKSEVLYHIVRHGCFGPEAFLGASRKEVIYEIDSLEPGERIIVHRHEDAT